MKDFIGIFPLATTKKYCDHVIEWFEYLKRSKEPSDIWHDGSGNGVISRQQLEGVESYKKDSELYFPDCETDKFCMETNVPILKEYNRATWDCYKKYLESYGMLGSLSSHNSSTSTKIQKYEPSQGYHIWHCDLDRLESSRRLLVSLLYLNTVEDGGETEFLYQSERVTPEAGTLILFPAGWTHTHRGNPPLKGSKYVINGWIELMA